MAGRRRDTGDKERTVHVRRADGEDFWVTPEAAAAIVGQGGEVISGGMKSTTSENADAVKAAVAEAAKPYEARIAELEQQLADVNELLTLVPTDVAAQLEELDADQSKGK